MGYTHEKKHLQAEAMAEAWMHKCDTYFFASDKKNDHFNAVHLTHVGGESYLNMVGGAHIAAAAAVHPRVCLPGAITHRGLVSCSYIIGLAFPQNSGTR